MIQDEIRLALHKRDYTHVDIQWIEPTLEELRSATTSLFPSYLQPDGLLSRVMVTISIEGKPVFMSSTDVIKRYWREWGEEQFMQMINGIMGRYDLNFPEGVVIPK